MSSLNRNSSMGEVGTLVLAEMRSRWDDELFPDVEENIDSGDEEDKDDRIGLFHSADKTEWVVLITCVVVLILFDFFVLQSMADVPYYHMKALAFWIFIGVCYNIYFWARNG